MNSPKAKMFFSALVLALASDQATKYWIQTNLEIFGRIDVVPGFFALTHVRNTGAAFGLLRDFPEAFRLPFFFAVSALAILLVISFYRRLAPGDRLSGTALGLVFGGAVGNLIDRIAYGEVIDFLQFRLWRSFTWPDFNFADSWIVIGVALLFVELLASESNPSDSGSGDPEGSASAPDETRAEK